MGVIGNPTTEFLIPIAISLLSIVITILIYRLSKEKKLIYWDCKLRFLNWHHSHKLRSLNKEKGIYSV